jgi:hypothetical protein
VFLYFIELIIFVSGSSRCIYYIFEWKEDQLQKMSFCRRNVSYRRQIRVLSRELRSRLFLFRFQLRLREKILVNSNSDSKNFFCGLAASELKFLFQIDDTPCTIGQINRADQRVRVRASKSVGAALSFMWSSTLLSYSSINGINNLRSHFNYCIGVRY